MHSKLANRVRQLLYLLSLRFHSLTHVGLNDLAHNIEGTLLVGAESGTNCCERIFLRGGSIHTRTQIVLLVLQRRHLQALLQSLVLPSLSGHFLALLGIGTLQLPGHWP